MIGPDPGAGAGGRERGQEARVDALHSIEAEME